MVRANQGSTVHRDAKFLRAPLGFGLSILVSLASAAQGPELLTLPEALRRVAASSVQADTARLDTDSAREDSLQVSALYTPHVTLEGGHLNLDNAPAFVDGPIVFPAGEKQSWHYKLDVRYLLWDFGRKSAAKSWANWRVQELDLRGAERVRQAQAGVAARYAEIFVVKAQKRVIAQRREALQEHLRTVGDLFDQGVVARNDLLRTEVSLRSVEDADRALDDTYATALEALNLAMGLTPAAPQRFPESIPPAPPLPWDEARCMQMAETTNGAVQVLSAKIQVLRERLFFQRKEYMPSIVSEVAHTYDQNKYMLHPWATSFFIGFSVNLFDGGTRASKIRQAERDLEKATREFFEAKRAAQAAAAQSLREFRQVLREARTAAANVEAALENLRIVEDQYREGIARNTDVLDAEQVLAESRFSLAQKDLLAYARQASLLAVCGQDLVAFYGGLDAPEAPKER